LKQQAFSLILNYGFANGLRLNRGGSGMFSLPSGGKGASRTRGSGPANAWPSAKPATPFSRSRAEHDSIDALIVDRPQAARHTAWKWPRLSFALDGGCTEISHVPKVVDRFLKVTEGSGELGVGRVGCVIVRGQP
jgi:hypothetical protein